MSRVPSVVVVAAPTFEVPAIATDAENVGSVTTSTYASEASRLGVGRAVGEGLASRPLQGRAAEHASATVAAAVATLEALGDRGWRAILGDAPGEDKQPRLGADAVVETADAFDPFDVSVAPGVGGPARVRRSAPAGKRRSSR